MAAHARKQSEPVLNRAGIVAAIAILSALLVHFGAASAGHWVDGHSNAIAGVILAVSPIVSAALSRLHVTPLSSPRDADGNELVAAGSAPATLDAQNVLAEMEQHHPATAA